MRLLQLVLVVVVLMPLLPFLLVRQLHPSVVALFLEQNLTVAMKLPHSTPQLLACLPPLQSLQLQQQLASALAPALTRLRPFLALPDLAAQALAPAVSAPRAACP